MYHYIHKHIYIYIDIYIRRLALLMGNIYDWLSLTLRSLYVSECFWSFIWFYVEVLSGLATNHSLLNHVISNPILLYTWCPANVYVSKFGSPTTRTSWILKLLKNTHVYDFEVCYGCPMRVFFFKRIPLQNESLPMDAPQALPWSPPCSKSSWRSCESKTWCPWGDNVAPNMLQLTMISMVCFAQWVSHDLEAVSLDHWIIIPGLCGFWTLAGQQSHKVYSKTWRQTHSSLFKW